MDLLYNDKEYAIVSGMLMEAENNQSVNTALEKELGDFENEDGKKSKWGKFNDSNLYKKVMSNATDIGIDISVLLKKSADEGNKLERDKQSEASVNSKKLTREKQNIVNALPGNGWNFEFKFDSTFGQNVTYAQTTTQLPKKESLLNNAGNELNEDLSDEDINDLLDYFNSHQNHFMNDGEELPQMVSEAEPEDEDYKKDSIYRAIYFARKDGSLTPEFEKAIKEIADIHNDILSMYTTAPYEDWDDSQEYKFHKFITIYKEKIDQLDEVLKDYKWNDDMTRARFYDLRNNVITHDYNSYVRVIMRHSNYLRYRSNRIGLVNALTKVIGMPTLAGRKSAENLFKFMSRYCDNYPLYNYEPIKKKSFKLAQPANSVVILEDMLADHRKEILDKINGSPDAGGIFYETRDFNDVASYYTRCRKSIYQIFNMFVSNRKHNGYNKWQNYFLQFCDNEISTATLEKLYNAATSNSTYDQADDYHILIDQATFNMHGIYESWWDEDVKWYHEHQPDKFSKDKILKINMIPTNANVCKIVSDGKSVYSAVKFYPGDIIEVCPARNINKDALYSKDMREIVFEVVPHEKWVLPFGYCQYYDTAGYGNDANCEYTWDADNHVIVIRATEQIPKHSKLVLKLVKL